MKELRPTQYFMMTLDHPLAPTHSLPAVSLPGQIDIAAIREHGRKGLMTSRYTTNLSGEPCVRIELPSGRIDVLLGEAPTGFEVEVEARCHLLLLTIEPDDEGQLNASGDELLVIGPWSSTVSHNGAFP